MAENKSEVQLFNTARQEAEQIVFPIIEGHRYYIRQARTGQTRETPLENINQNQRKLNRVKALHLIISSQKDMIQISRPTVRWNTLKAWEKKNKKDDEKLDNPFEKQENDYNRLIELKNFLSFLSSEITKAEKSVTKDDDFLIEREIDGETQLELTKNFEEMLEELEDTYEDINIIMIKHKIVSAGISEDEELTYKEQEQEMIRRVVEA